MTVAIRAHDLFTAAHSLGFPSTWNIRLEPGKIGFEAISARDDAMPLLNQLRGAVPDLDVRSEPYRPRSGSGLHVSAAISTDVKGDLGPIRSIDNFGPVDSHSSLLEAFLPL